MAAEDEEQLLRLGKISSINYPAGTARITFEDRDGSTTAELPMLSWMYFPPRIGDQVLVAHLPNGQAAAIILGRFWCNGHRPIQGRPDYYRQEFSNYPGLAFEDFYVPSKTYKLQIGKTIMQITTDGKITIIAPDGISIKTKDLFIKADDGITLDTPSVSPYH